jgi:hypothetical protein
MMVFGMLKPRQYHYLLPPHHQVMKKMMTKTIMTVSADHRRRRRRAATIHLPVATQLVYLTYYNFHIRLVLRMKMNYYCCVHVLVPLHELQLDEVIAIDVVLLWVVSVLTLLFRMRLHCCCFDFVVTSAAVVALVVAARHLLAADDCLEQGGAVSPLGLSCCLIISSVVWLVASSNANHGHGA